MIERERDLTFFYSFFTFSKKGFNQILMYCPQNKKKEEKENENEPAVGHRMIGT